MANTPYSGALRQYLGEVSASTGYPIPIEKLSFDHLLLRHIAKTIDHSLLNTTLTDQQLREGCELAREYNVASVCIAPTGIELAIDILDGSDVAVGTIVGFPHPNKPTAVKVYETDLYCNMGATEIDMVAHTGKVKSGEWDYVRDDIKAVMEAAKEYDAIVKVIFENDFLDNDQQKIKLCKICNELRVDFAKTSTGYGFVKKDPERGLYGYDGATDHDLELMREHCNPKVQIKAAGGVRTLDRALEVIARGVTRIGATATKEILEAAKEKGYK